VSMRIFVDGDEPLLRFALLINRCCEVVKKLVAEFDALGVSLLGNVWDFLDFYWPLFVVP
jgi:hypothetical protein